jgi:hypothetical protein
MASNLHAGLWPKGLSGWHVSTPYLEGMVIPRLPQKMWDVGEWLVVWAAVRSGDWRI